MMNYPKELPTNYLKEIISQLQLRKFIIEISDIFYDSNQPIRTTHVTTHEINLQPNQKPINAHAIHHGPADRIEIEKQVDDMLKKNMI
jgi:hypothetical protein